MKSVIKMFLFRFWIYILTTIYTQVNNNIKSEDDELYVVYLSHLNNDLYVCRGGNYALQLVNHLNHVNKLVNRPLVKVLYGKVDIVFKFKIVKLSDIIFCFDADIEQRKKIYNYIADVPLQR